MFLFVLLMFNQNIITVLFDENNRLLSCDLSRTSPIMSHFSQMYVTIQKKDLLMLSFYCNSVLLLLQATMRLTMGNRDMLTSIGHVCWLDLGYVDVTEKEQNKYRECILQ